mmetsp:Transcript_47777/g.76576  ORF Transcript_47777/g.76576 Transcript_47777/m.76576 type:complete len:84 (-) Transcript_47777:277-528(-)
METIVWRCDGVYALKIEEETGDVECAQDAHDDEESDGDEREEFGGICQEGVSEGDVNERHEEEVHGELTRHEKHDVECLELAR